jgi:hypothetical protein
MKHSKTKGRNLLAPIKSKKDKLKSRNVKHKKGIIND